MTNMEQHDHEYTRDIDETDSFMIIYPLYCTICGHTPQGVKKRIYKLDD